MPLYASPASQIIFRGDVRPVRFFTKLDPSKAVWAPLKLTFSTEILPPLTSYSSYVYNTGTGAAYSYGGTQTSGYGVSTYGSSTYPTVSTVGVGTQSGGIDSTNQVTNSSTYVPKSDGGQVTL